VIVVDEYIVLRVLVGSGEVDGLPDEIMGLTYLRHWRLVSTIAKSVGAVR